MKNVDDVKKALVRIQSNFNPEKATYKIIDSVIKGDYSASEMEMELSKIKGVDKYPEQLKKNYKDIILTLQNIIISERKLEEERKRKQNTNELKNIIESLEKSKKVKDDFNSDEKAIDDNVKEDGLDEKNLKDNSIDNAKVFNNEESDKTLGRGLFLFLLVMVFLTIIIGVLILLFF